VKRERIRTDDDELDFSVSEQNEKLAESSFSPSSVIIWRMSAWAEDAGGHVLPIVGRKSPARDLPRRFGERPHHRDSLDGRGN
jgi:hypothetical protein